ncbi:alpha/beta fold hydrolase [uncultured Leifsonia sp.]|uniref:esterase/lipase family protein n=1 Tax=uncultured Leifsonia sp. TaxID=340359 RepID=UPI0028D2ACB9|nr:alpha/beta fold hydrolase [uncultured Leifsonia sp.]
MTLLRRVGVLLLDYEYVLRHQLAALFDRSLPEALVDGTGGSTPVVLLPGIYETWRFLRPLARRLHAAGHPVHVISALGDNRMSLTEAADRVRAHLERFDLREVTIVAHSKGGLVARLLLATPGVEQRIRRAVTVAAPFSGSTLARYVPLAAVRALRPGAAELRSVSGTDAGVGRIVSVWGWWDPHIPGGSRLDGARNIPVPVGGHFRILGSPLVLRLIVELAD